MSISKNDISDLMQQGRGEEWKLYRRHVYSQIFKGKLQQGKNIFQNPGYRGVHILPYPKHVQKMIYEIKQKVKKYSPERPVPIYLGMEIVPNIDQKVIANKSPVVTDRVSLNKLSKNRFNQKRQINIQESNPKKDPSPEPLSPHRRNVFQIYYKK